MTEEYDRFLPVYEFLKKSFEELAYPITILKKEIFNQAQKHIGKLEPSEEKLFIEGLEKYFLKFRINVYESKIVKGEKAGEPVLRFENLSKEEEKYAEFFEIYKALGQVLDKFIEKYEEYTIDINDIIKYANNIMPKDKKVPSGEFFLIGLEWYLSDKPDLYLPLESKRAGIEMETKPLVSMTGDRIGNIATFKEIR